jgi:hypothetical protein
MYSIISSLATPIIICNAARNYFAWLGYSGDDSNDFYRRQKNLNNLIAASIFFTGAVAVGMHAMKFQKPTPLIMSAMA